MLAAALIAALLAAQSAPAMAQMVWTGYLDQWSDNTNWNPSGPPSSTTDVLIDMPNGAFAGPYINQNTVGPAETANIVIGKDLQGSVSPQDLKTLNVYGNAILGQNTGSLGIVLLQGGNLNVSGDLIVGAAGSGEIKTTASSGGIVSVGGALRVGQLGMMRDFIVLSTSGEAEVNSTVSNGRGVIVDGNINTVRGSQWHAYADVYIGRTSDGSVTVTSGLGPATFFLRGDSGTIPHLHVGAGAGVTGLVDFQGGSLVSNSLNATVSLGENGGTGIMNLTNTNSTMLGTLSVGTSGTGQLNVAGGLLSLGKLTSGSGPATVTFDNAIVTNTMLEGISYDTTISGFAGPGQSINILGGGLTLNAFDNRNIFVNAPLSGAGGVTTSGPGTVYLNAANTYIGPTVLGQGALVVNGSITSDTTVNSDATLGGVGTIFGNVANNGTIEPGFSREGRGHRLTVNGNYVGSGDASIKLKTEIMEGDNANTDQLIIAGAGHNASGSSKVLVEAIGASLGPTTTYGIPIIVAQSGATTDATAFTLGNRVVGGAHEYFLFRGPVHGGKTLEETNTWYLRSCVAELCVEPTPPDSGPNGNPNPDAPLYRGEVAMHAIYGAMARQLGLLTLGTFHERYGDQQLAGVGDRERAWGRVFGQYMEQSHSGTVRPHTEGEYTGIQVGIDAIRTVSQSGAQDRAGLFAAYANANVDVAGYSLGIPNRKVGRTDLEAASLGGYWSHLARSGWYTDAVVMGTTYDGDGGTIDKSRVGVSGSGFIASLEGGFPIFKLWGMKLEQQGQLVYQYLNLDEANDPFSHVVHDTPDAFHGRVGWRLSADGLPWMFRPFLKANIWQDFAGKDSATYDHTHEIVNRHRSTTLELGGGVVANLAPNMGFWINSDYTMDIGGTEQEREAWRGTAGLRITW